MTVDEFTFDDYLDSFCELPDRIINIEYKDLLKEDWKDYISENDQFIIDCYLDLYHILSFRLRNKIRKNQNLASLCDDNDPDFIKFVDSEYVKSLSELYLIEYKLIREIWKVCNENEIKLPEKFRSPEHWWYLIRYDECLKALIDKCLFGGNSKTIGKKIGEKQIKTDYFDKYFPKDKRHPDKFLTGREEPVNGASEALETYIFNLIKLLSNGETRKLNGFFEDLRDIQVSVNDSIVKNPKLKGILHNDETFKVLYKNMKIPKEFKY
jgi:hypothetical protein